MRSDCSVVATTSQTQAKRFVYREGACPRNRECALERVEKLIAEGVDFDATDSRGNTAIYHAASKGHADVVEALAQAGADIEIDNSLGPRPCTSRAATGTSK